MKLKQDCVRHVLINLEAQRIEMIYIGVKDSIIARETKNNDFTEDDIIYTLQQLFIGDFIKAKSIKAGKLERPYLIVYDLTWSGHELLNTIRDDKVWAKTKEVTSSFKSVSIGIIKNVATEVLSNLVKGVLKL